MSAAPDPRPAELAPVALSLQLPPDAVPGLDGDLLAAIAAVRGNAGKATMVGDFERAKVLGARLSRLRSLRGALRQAARALGPDARSTMPTKPGAA